MCFRIGLMLLAEQPVFLLRLNEPTNAKVLMNTIAAINQTFGTDRLDENTFFTSIRVCATCAWTIFLQTFSETKLILTTIASFACFTSDIFLLYIRSYCAALLFRRVHSVTRALACPRPWFCLTPTNITPTFCLPPPC